MMYRIPILFASLIFFVLPQTQEYQVQPSDPQPFSHFGEAVSIHGSTAVVGAWAQSVQNGAIYIYEFDGTTWEQIDVQAAYDSDTNDNFGSAVSISGDLIAVGSPRDNSMGADSGSLYILEYDGSGWTQQLKWYPEDGHGYAYLGNAVSTNGSDVLVGAWKDDQAADMAGAAYIYNPATDSAQKLIAGDGDFQDNFGNAVAIADEGKCIIGAWHDEELGFNSGSAYIFERIGASWFEFEKLTASNGEAYDEFGTSVDISGNVAAVGAPGVGTELGCVYIFEKISGVWTETQQLYPSQISNLYGTSVSISGNQIVVGDRVGESDRWEPGIAYIYEWDGEEWVENQVLAASDGGGGDEFGWAVAIDDDRVIIGAPGFDTEEGQSGAAYIYHLEDVMGGCTNPAACNYNPEATVDDGSCIYPEQEVCDDGSDNDCDGDTDMDDSECECLPETVESCGTTDVGECQYGLRTCNQGYVWGDCIGNIDPTEEICDGLDNNCNGEVDEFYPVGLPCDNGEYGVCFQQGEYVCFGPDETICNAPSGVGNAEPEICNDNLDNDCDGILDMDDSDCNEFEIDLFILDEGQRTDGSQIVDIIYDMEGDQNSYIVSMDVSFDGGENFEATSTFLPGSAIGEAVAPGAELWIGWEAGSDFPDTFSADTRIRITADYDEDLDPIRDLTILYTNDEHGWMVREGDFGGGAEIMGQWREVEGYTEDGPFLIISGGDNWTGPAISTWFQGESMVEMMNAMNYSAAVIGNHEFDFGLETLEERFDQADFPYLSANMVREDNGDLHPLATEYTIVEVNDIDVGIIGLTFQGADDINFPGNVENIDFIEYGPVLTELVPEVRAAGAELLILATHMCYDETSPLSVLAEELGITLIGGGHCHSLYATIENNVGLMEGGAKLRAYDRAIIEFDILNDVVTSLDVSTQFNTGLYVDEDIQEIVEYWQTQLDNDLSQVIGYVENEVGQQSNAMHNLITDSWLESYPADVSLTNTGGIRQPMPAGDITFETWVGILPFENYIVDMQLTGQELLDNLGNLVMGGMTTIPYPMLLDGTPIDPEATYSVLTTDYIYETYDNFNELDPNAYETSIHFRQPVIDWINSLGTSPDDPLDNYLDYVGRR